MTAAQHRRYLRFWSAAFARHWCGVKGGEPIARPDRGPSHVRDEIVAVAGGLAGPNRLTPDLLRHACHVSALGRDVSSHRLSNKQQDLVIAVFQRLAEGDQELAGQLRSDARAAEVDRIAGSAAAYAQADGGRAPWKTRRPDADRKRLLWSLTHSGYPENAIEAISVDKFGVRAWQGLDDAALYQLLLTVKRAAACKAAAAAPQNARGPAAPLPARVHDHHTSEA